MDVSRRSATVGGSTSLFDWDRRVKTACHDAQSTRRVGISRVAVVSEAVCVSWWPGLARSLACSVSLLAHTHTGQSTE